MRHLPRRALAALAISGMTASAALAQQGQSVSEQEARDIARDAYIYAYPMLVMEMTRRVCTNVEKPDGARAPMNQIANVRAFPDPSFTDVVRPNADTLYSVMFFDVSKDPMVFSVPDSGGRYYLLPMLDMWTDVFALPGKRTTGTGAQTFAVVGPHWQGQLPKGVERDQEPDVDRLHDRAHADQRQSRLRRRAQVPGRPQGRAAQPLRQGLHAAEGHGERRARYEFAVRPGAQDGRGDVLCHLRRAVEDQPAARQRLSDPGAPEAHRHRARQELLARLRLARGAARADTPPCRKRSRTSRRRCTGPACWPTAGAPT